MAAFDENDSFAFIMKNGRVYRYSGETILFDSLEQAADETEELILAVPFRQALWGHRPTSDVEKTARQHVSALRVRERSEESIEDFILAEEQSGVEIFGGHFDINDHDYAEMVRDVVESEIKEGHGSNFVLHRTYRGKIGSRSLENEVAIFRSLLRSESGAYWTFLVHFPDHTLIGASPEMHLRRSTQGLMTMNPISGTYRYPSGGPEERSLRDFLLNPKERDELYMVVDEELKIMSDLCDERPWVSDPKLRFMSKLAHTEYHIHGYSTLPWHETLKMSLVAPTVLGSPLESAFRMAHRKDASPRDYLGGVLAHVSASPSKTFDSAILIRTARIEENDEISIPVGSTIVRDSDPESESAETTAKVSGVLSAFSSRAENALEKMANEILERRLGDVAAFWRNSEVFPLQVSNGRRLKAVVVDHEDRFVGMLAAHLRSLGLAVEICQGTPGADLLDDADLLVLGPGPGDPNDGRDLRLVEARKLVRWVVENRSIPTLAVCLSHQLVCRELGLEVQPLPHPNQGAQKRIRFFDDDVTVGFYNSFSAYAKGDIPQLEVARDAESGEVHAIRTDNIVGVQFHPESVLSVDGAHVLERAVEHLLSPVDTLAVVSGR